MHNNSRQQFVVIDVPFDVDYAELEAHRSSLLELLIQRNRLRNMPWLEYLIEHTQKFETDTCYDVAAMMYRLRFRFYLTSSDATMYRLRYS